jgi:hypothetical protein
VSVRAGAGTVVVFFHLFRHHDVDASLRMAVVFAKIARVDVAFTGNGVVR